MNLEKFEKLDEEKRIRIIEAAIEEFNINGYLAASTNNIVKNAGISKGSLFDYFENKQNLFFYLFKITIQKISENFQKEKFKLQNLDLFEGLQFFINGNIIFFTNNPKIFNFLAKGMTSSPIEIRNEMLKIKRNLQGNIINYLITNTDSNYFRQDIQKEQIEFFVLTLLDSLSNIYIERYNGDIEKLKEFNSQRELEVEAYINLIKHGILNK